jgi:hypothetical protein
MRRRLAHIVAGFTFVLFLWLFMPMEQKNRFRTIWDPNAGPRNAAVSAEGRIKGFESGMAMFKRYPLTGVGIGNFKAYRAAQLDGPFSAHNLVGQLLGETGLLGGLTFVLMVAVILASCRQVGVLAREHFDPELKVLSGLATACRDAVILLLFDGLFAHNVRRFNWLWLAAFSALAVKYAKRGVRKTPLRGDTLSREKQGTSVTLNLIVPG